MKMKLVPISYTMAEVRREDGVRVLFHDSRPVAAYVPGRGCIRLPSHDYGERLAGVSLWLLTFTFGGYADTAFVKQPELDALVGDLAGYKEV